MLSVRLGNKIKFLLGFLDNPYPVIIEQSINNQLNLIK